MDSQKVYDTTAEATLDFDEMLECIARCGCDKYRAIKQIDRAGATLGMIKNLLGEGSEEQVVDAATYIRVERFAFEETDSATWNELWPKLQLETLPGFPLWEKDVHDALLANLLPLQAVFETYAAGTFSGGALEMRKSAALEMDADELHDLVVEAQLATPA
eukprot:1537213-Prymnesium_polylepis.1